LQLGQNYPNPFNSGTEIRFALARREEISLAIYNLAGQQVATLVDGSRSAGAHTAHWAGRVYLYRLQTGSQVQTRKLVLAR
jgi:hypothetical protein